MNGTPVRRIWYNGARTAGDFTDRHTGSGVLESVMQEYVVGRMTSPSQKSPTVFAYQGRYYFVTCYSGFGLSGHPGYPGPMNGSAAECP